MAEVSSRMLEIPRKIVQEVSRVIVGKDDIKELLLVALISGGHVLIEGLPGTAKTSLARSFARAMGGQFKRIQLTPDMLPADITGFYLYSVNGSSRFVQGPLFANIVLADELNRTTPRTQSALLEAMQENQVTIEGQTYPLPKPFMVIASQLAYGSEGTYPLSEVSGDRFLFRIWSGYPSQAEEKLILSRIDEIGQTNVEAVVTPDELLQVQAAATRVFISDEIADYIVSLVSHVRKNPDILAGPSPRGSIAIFRGARSLALLNGREFVLPDDVKRLLVPALEHRTRLKPEAEMEGVTASNVLQTVVEEVPVPKSA